MQIDKTMQVKVIYIGPGKVRSASATTPNAPQTVKDCIQAYVAVVDNTGRYLNRSTITFADGKMTVGASDLGTAPDSLNTALTTVFSELDKAISTLIAAGKLSL